MLSLMTMTMMGMMMVSSPNNTPASPNVRRRTSSSNRLRLLLISLITAASRRNVTLVTGASPTGVVVLRLGGGPDGYVGDDVLVGAAVGFDACVAYVCCACFFVAKVC